MDSIVFLAFASAIVWVGIGAYISFIALKQRTVSSRLKQLEILHHDNS